MSVIGKGSHGIVLRTSHGVIKLPLPHNSGERPLFRDLYYLIANGYFQEAICYDNHMCLKFIDSVISMLAFIKAGGHHLEQRFVGTIIALIQFRVGLLLM